MTIHECANCHALVPAPRSRWLGGLALALAYVVTFAYASLVAWTGPLGLVLLPLFLPPAIGGISSAHAYARDEQPCPVCGKLAGCVATRSRRPAVAVAVGA